MRTINENFVGLKDMTTADMMNVNGGDSVWEIVGYYIGVGLKTLYVVGKTAGEYQGSLPPSLKK